MKNVILLAISLSSLTVFASANEPVLTAELRDHLTITSVEVTDLTEQYEAFQNAFQFENDQEQANQSLSDKLDAVDVVVDKVVNIGQKIWNVVEKGRPVANYAKLTGNALPEKTLRWDQLQNWSAPRAKVVSVVYKNLYGMEVVRFTYKVILLYGGNVNGVGRYIGYATVEPMEMSVGYLYNFDASVSVESVYNMGTSANPVAGMILNVNWTISTVLKKSTESHSYSLDARGNIKVPTEQFQASHSLQ